MWLNFCSSLTLTLCALAMEVSVSPRATMWLFPLSALADGSGDAAVDVVDVADVDAGGAPSPIMTPGRWLDSCDWSLRICCESMSIFAFCSSIFLVSA
jgi:hypothetical protein